MSTSLMRSDVSLRMLSPIAAAVLCLIAPSSGCATRPPEVDTRKPAAGESLRLVDGELVASPWTEVADQLCCEDHLHAAFGRRGWTFPAFVIDDDTEHLAIASVPGAFDDPTGPLPADLFWLLRSRDSDLPPGRLRFARTKDGFLVGTDRGEFGGGLIFVSADGQLQVFSDEEQAVTGVVAVPPVAGGSERAIVVRRVHGYESSVVCLERAPDSTWWSVRAEKSLSTTGILGADALGHAIFAGRSGELLAVRCDHELEAEPVWTIPMEDFVEWRERPRVEVDCKDIAPPTWPVTTRRFADGVVAWTSRHFVILLRPGHDGGLTDTWFRRPHDCTATPDWRRRFEGLDQLERSLRESHEATR